MQLAEPVLAYLDTVDFDPDGSVARVRPLGHNTPVVIDPEIQYGIPQIGSIADRADRRDRGRRRDDRAGRPRVGHRRR